MKELTRNALLNALNRLVDGNPNHPELKQKAQNGKLKVNRSTVEKEAGKSAGALRNHPDIVELIIIKTLDAKVSVSETAASHTEVLQEEVQEIKAKLKASKDKERENYERWKRDEEALKIQSATHVKMVEKLLAMIPKHEREKALKSVINTTPDNVVPLNKSGK